MRALLLALVLAVVPGHAATALEAAGQDGPAQEAAGQDGAGPVFRFGDRAITEASGLVDQGDVMVTANDSGSGPVLYVVDARTGATLGRTHYTDEVVDVEALAPGPGPVVWVGDIGDNRRRRTSVRIHLVPVIQRDSRIRTGSFEVVYPDGAHDAESLFTGPDGRLYVVTKALFGGAVYALPATLDPAAPNRLTKVAPVSVLATDAAGIPGTTLVLVRGYGSAEVLDLATGKRVGQLDLPRQPQGEAISVGPDRRIRVTSEGAHAAVLAVAAPGWLRRAIMRSQGATAASAGVDAGRLGAMLG
jgi:hypothetical protein